MGKVIEWTPEPPICSIPLPLAVYCVNCNTISTLGRIAAPFAEARLS
jgi:hypothetical protein